MFPWLITSLAASASIYVWGGIEHPLWAVIAANLSGLVTLLIVQTLERQTRLKSGILKGFVRTWIVCGALFFGLLLLLVPDLRDFDRFIRLCLPLMFAAGLITPWVFGPIQDRIVRHVQRKARGFTTPAPRAKS